ncbi:MAG: T9SS type A sorting domain-containing protein [Candidatus Kapaibacterium sp.]
MKKFLYLLFFVIASQVVVAQWAQCSIGQYERKFYTLHTDGTSLFASTYDAGLFRSDDGGEHWPGHNWLPVSYLTASGSTILAMDSKNGIHRLLRSTDKGEHWTNIWPDSLATKTIGPIAINGSFYYVSTPNGIFRSADNGSTWTKIVVGYDSFFYVYALADSVIFAGNNYYGLSGHGIFKSTDNGSTWQRVKDGLVDINSIIVSGTTVFAAHTTGILRSTDNGKSWQTTTTGMTDTNITTIVASGTYLFAASYTGILYRSSDNGDHWTAVNSTNSTFNLKVRSLTAIGTSVFVGPENGHLYRSTDAGDHWKDISSGMAYQIVTSLAANSAGVYASSETGVLRSTDDGTTWQPANTGLFHQRIEKFFSGERYVYAVGSSHPSSVNNTGNSIDAFRSPDNGTTWEATGSVKFSNIILETNKVLFSYVYDTLFRSIDYGATWIPSKFRVSYDLALQAIGSTLYLTSSNDTAYRSTDNGASWSVIRIDTSIRKITSIAPIDSIIFARTNQGDLFRSNDNGVNWTEVSIGLLQKNFTTLLVSGSTLFARTSSNTIYRSSDLGGHWSLVQSDTTTLICQDIFVSSKCIFLQTVDKKIYRSSDNGLLWKEVTTIQPMQTFLSIVELGSALYAQYKEGILRSTDNGDNWTEVFQGVTNGQIASLAVSDSILLAGTASDGLYRSSDKGNTWQQVTPVLRMDWSPYLYSYQMFYTIAAIDSNLYVGTQTYGSLYKSSDNGDTWKVAHRGLYSPGYVTCMAGRDTLIYAGMQLTGLGGPALCALFRSVDTGKSWYPISKGLSRLQDISIGGIMGALAVQENSLFVGIKNGSGIQMTDNDGATWDYQENGLRTTGQSKAPGINCFAVNGNTLFTGTNNGIYRSTNNGENWERINTGLRGDTIVLCLTVSGSTVFAGTSKGGIFRSTDNGDSWIPKNTTLIVTPVNALAVRGTTIFAATQGEGIFRAQVTDFAPTDVEEQPASLSSSLRISPMPISGDYLTISNIPASASELHIYSLLGEIVHSESLNGSERRQMNVSGLPAGVYYLQVGMETRMVIKQ